MYSLAQGLQKRPSEIVKGFKHPIKDFIFDMMVLNKFTTDDKGRVKQNNSVSVDELVDAHEHGVDELSIAEMLGVKVVRRNNTTDQL